MTDREFIFNFLNKNYTVYADNDLFKVKSLATDVAMLPDWAINEFKVIIGSFSTTCGKNSVDLFNEWFLEKKKEITKKLYDYLDKIKKNNGSIKMFSDLRKKFKKSEYSQPFMLKILIEFYIEKYMKPMVKEFIDSFTGDNTLTSNKIQEYFNKKLDHETDEVRDFAYDYLNEWYCDNILEDKINELFNEFIIILGEKNWIVRWIGHGTLTNEKLSSNFRGENEVIMKYIKRKYEKWYDDNVVKASEKMMGYC